MKVSIKIRLSDIGRKAQALGGKDPSVDQEIVVEQTDPYYTAVVQAGSFVANDVVLNEATWNSPMWDHLPSPQEVLDSIAARKTAKEEEARLEVKKRHDDTLAVVMQKKTRSDRTYIDSVEEGERVSVDVVRYFPEWPYNADPAVKASPEAVAWVTELDTANALAIEKAKESGKEILVERLAAKKLAKEKEAARRASLGLQEGDLDLAIEDGALTECPVWETHKRGKNWMAVITADPSSPGGLARDFAAKAKGSSFYMVPALQIGQAIEFGGDYTSGGGHRSPERWFGYVVRVELNGGNGYIVLHKCATGKAAITAGGKFVAKQKEKSDEEENNTSKVLVEGQ